MRPFEGIRVLDFTRVVAGPYCTHLLGLLGAEIIKIEEPVGGDNTRKGSGDPMLTRDGLSAEFVMFNAGKRSVALDLKSPQARAIILRLVRETDVVVENFRAGVIDRLGLGHAALSAVNPRLIFCSISGYGQTGPESHAAAFDPTIQAASGMMSLSGESGGPPMRAGYSVADTGTGLQAALAIAAALYQRTHSDKGQYIDVAMLDSAMALTAQSASTWLNAGTVQERRGNRPINHEPASGTFSTADGTLMLAVMRDDHFKAFARATGLDDLADDVRCTSRESRVAHSDSIRALVEARLVTATTGEWKRRLDEAGIPCAPVLELHDALAQPQVRHRGMVVEMTDALTGKPMRVFNAAFKYAHDTPEPAFAPHRLGEDTDAVLLALGCGEAEIEDLARRGIIGRPRSKHERQR